MDLSTPLASALKTKIELRYLLACNSLIQKMISHFKTWILSSGKKGNRIPFCERVILLKDHSSVNLSAWNSIDHHKWRAWASYISLTYKLFWWCNRIVYWMIKLWKLYIIPRQMQSFFMTCKRSKIETFINLESAEEIFYT